VGFANNPSQRENSALCAAIFAQSLTTQQIRASRLSGISGKYAGDAVCGTEILIADRSGKIPDPD
jgi:hypothetical protein